MEKSNQKSNDSDGVVTQGKIHVHHKGFAFVSIDDSEKFPEDVFIPKHLKGKQHSKLKSVDFNNLGFGSYFVKC